MNPDSPIPENDANLSALGRELLHTGGSKPSGPWVPPTAEELQKFLPGYDILKMLGRGGMGAVYMGTQTALDRPVAIKILSAALEESDRGFTERFKNEAKAMAKLNHPGIVSVYDFGEAPGGLLYIVMEYVDGTDVARMIAAKGRLHTDHAMAITAHVCDALAYAHERGIIHRDIKPANIMVGYDGIVKVADFGLAKVHGKSGETLGLTQSGMAMGTLHYMAPEALMLGTAVDHRADIYAVGVMLYQMLTGKVPHGMFTMPSLQVPGLDPRYDSIIAKAMMEDRDARYQEIGEMRTSLDGILTQPVIKVEPAAADAPAQGAMLPTNARPQRPGTRQPAPPRSTGAHAIPHETPRSSLAWLWMTALVLAVLGGVAWVNFGIPNQPVTETALPTGPNTTQSSVVSEKTATTTVPSATVPPATVPPATVPSATVPPATVAPAMVPAVPTQPSAEEPAATDFVSLFNGKDLSGWRIIGNPRGFAVDQGSIMTGGVRADLVYTGSGGVPEAFSDFELRMKVKTGNRGNSGLWFHLPVGIQSTREADLSLQVQIDNGFDQQRTGSIVHLLPLDHSPVADGVWFELRVLVQNKTVTSFVDGKQVNKWTQPDNWNPPAKAALARMGAGTIGLESWKGNVWFRDIQLRLLKDSKSGTAPDTKLILGRWTRTNMDRPGDAYLMDLSADGSALWTGDNTTVRGTWQFKSGVLEVDWNSRFKFLLTPPSSTTASAILKGTANWPDGKSTEIVYERQQSAPAAAAPTWTDTKGRSLQAFFVRLEGSSVTLAVAGKLTPIAMDTLSPASQNLARTMQNQAAALAGNKPRNDLAILQQQLSNAGASDFFATSKFLYAVFPKKGPQGPDPKAAPQLAKQLGGRLPIFHSRDDFLKISSFAKSMARKHQTDYLTLGMSRAQDGAVQWDDGVKVTDYIAWDKDPTRGFFRIQLDRVGDTKFGYQAFDPEGVGHARPVLLVQYELEDQQSGSPPKPAQSVDTGWAPLFTNNSLSGWKGDVAGYRLVNGILTSTVNGGDLISPKEYGNFHLKFDLRLSSGSNNGIGVWCADNKGPYKHLAHTGFEIQLLDDLSPTYTTGKPWQSHGALTYFISPKAKPMGAPMTWNTHEIRMEGTRLTVIINNITVIDQELPTGDPVPEGSRRHRLDLSKKRGHIVFCGMKGPVDFRNAQIKELP